MTRSRRRACLPPGIENTEGGSGRTAGIVEAVLSGGAEVDGGKCDLMMPIEYVAHFQVED